MSNEIMEPIETVSADYARKVAGVYIASFANQVHEPDIFLRQLVVWLTGKPKAVIEKLNHPEIGAVARSDKPCLKTINKWFADWTGRPEISPTRPWREIPPDPEVPPLETREKDVERWKSVRYLIAQNVEKATRPFPRPSESDPMKLMEALSNLERSRGDKADVDAD